MARVSFYFLLFLTSLNCKAGYDLLFCKQPDSMSTCKEAGSVFDMQNEKTSLYVIVMNKDEIKFTKLKFMVFLMNNDREGTLYANLSQPVGGQMFYVVKQVYFYKPGYYKVDVLDDKNNFLTSGFVTITDRRE